MKKSLILYCINLLRHCPDPWGTGGAPCRMGFPIDGGRQAGMCGIPCNTGSFRAASVLSRAGMFLLCCEIWQRSVIPPSPAPGCSGGLGPIVAGCPASFRDGTFPGPSFPGGTDGASRPRTAGPACGGNCTFTQGRFNNLSTGALCLCNVLFSDIFSLLETKRFRLRFSPSFSA